jgi:hypothetical protein
MLLLSGKMGINGARWRPGNPASQNNANAQF